MNHPIDTRLQTRKTARFPAKDHRAVHNQKGHHMTRSVSSSVPRPAWLRQAAGPILALIAAVASFATLHTTRQVQRQALAMERARLLTEQQWGTASAIIHRASEQAATSDEGEPLLMESDERIVDDVPIGSRLWEQPDGRMRGYLTAGGQSISDLTPEQMREAAAHLSEMVDAAEGVHS